MRYSPLTNGWQIMGIKSHVFEVGLNDDDSAAGDAQRQISGKNYRVQLTAKERKRVEGLIKNAKSLSEIARLEKELNEGRIPGGALAAGGDDDGMEE